MTRIAWPSAATDRLLSTIEFHKGDQSPYLDDEARTEAIDQMAIILNTEFGEVYSREKVLNKIRLLWDQNRKPIYKNSHWHVLFEKGRDALDSYCHPKVLELRGDGSGQRARSRHIIKQLGLDRTPGCRKRPPKMRARQGVSKAGQSVASDSEETLGSAEATNTNHLPGSTTAMTHVSVPKSHNGNATTANHFQLETPASLFSRPSYSPVTPTSRCATPRPVLDRFESHTQSWTAPSSCPSTVERVPVLAPELTSFMRHDLRRYLPSHSLLRDLEHSMFISIETAVNSLLNATNTNPKDTPHIIAHMSKPPFLQLCRLMFGVNSTPSLMDAVSWRQRHSLLPLGELLCSVVATAGYEWILLGQHESLPPGLPEKTEYVRLMEKNIASVSPNFLDHFTRELKNDFVQSPRGLDIYTKSLAHQLFDVLRPFLQGTLTNCSDSSLTAFIERLGEVFSEAFKLSSQRSLQWEELCFKWVVSGQPFDPKYMKAERSSSWPQDARVRLCLSPALIETRKVDHTFDTIETVVFQARVSLR